ncbi:MAG: hypothetical protein CL489_08625 [Acidobacteria bacterium]|nr:hypothetical protein [Acidobacteriota bacterium]|tara:strand:- start:36927 stop:37310 length:384 start_codon:yes stop_codon:yes gene_type:complete
MKLGTETGSLVNHLYSRIEKIKPEIGMGATILGWTDRSPATVIETFTKGKYDYIVVQEDSAKRVDNNGMSENQEYEYTRNPEGCTYTFRVIKDGFQEVYKAESGRYNKLDGKGLLLGTREKYYDFSF